jgi:hypothetical protein
MAQTEKRSELGNLLALRTLEHSTNCPIIRNSVILGSEVGLKCGYCKSDKKCNDYRSIKLLRKVLK